MIYYLNEKKEIKIEAEVKAFEIAKNYLKNVSDIRYNLNLINITC